MKLTNQLKKSYYYLPLTASGKTFLAFSVYLKVHIIVLNNHICSPNLIRQCI